MCEKVTVHSHVTHDRKCYFDIFLSFYETNVRKYFFFSEFEKRVFETGLTYNFFLCPIGKESFDNSAIKILIEFLRYTFEIFDGLFFKFI